MPQVRPIFIAKFHERQTQKFFIKKLFTSLNTHADGKFEFKSVQRQLFQDKAYIASGFL